MWDSKPLEEIVSFQRGLTYSKADEVSSSNTIVLRANNIELESHELDLTDLRYVSDRVVVPSNKIVRKDSLLICTASGSKAHLGKVALIDEDYGYAFGGFMGMLTPRPSILPRYLYYALISPSYRNFIDELADGANINNLKFSDLGKFNVKVPPLAEQQRIAGVLDEVLRKIKKAMQSAEANVVNSQRLLLSVLHQAFSIRREQWTTAKVSTLAEHCLGKMLDKSKNRGIPREYLRNINVRWFDVDTNDLLTMRFEADERERYSVRKGDLVICEGGYPGRAAIWDREEEIYFQKAIHRVRFKEAWLAKWLMYLLYYHDGTGSLRSWFSGAGIQHFTGIALAKFEIPVPPSEIGHALVTRIDAVRNEVDNVARIYRQKAAIVEKLRESVLSQAFAYSAL